MHSIPLQSLPLSSPERVCTKCGLLKRLEEFSIKVSATGRRDTRCKTCMNAYCAERFKANPARQKAANDAWRTAHSEQHKAANDAYTATHREEAKARGAAWAAAHVEERRAASAAWRSANKDRHNALIAAWASTHKEQRQATARAWWQTNKDRLHKQTAAWAKANPGKRYANFQRRRRRIKAAGKPYTGVEWEALKATYEYRCLMCHRQEPEIKLTFDHVIPTVLGGTNDISNGQPLCVSCNSHKHTQVIDLR